MTELQVVQFIKYIYLFFAAFDIGIALYVLLSKEADKSISKSFFIAFFAVGVWEIIMWFSLFTWFSNVANYVIDHLSYGLGAIAAFSLLYILWKISDELVLSKKAIQGYFCLALAILFLSLIPNLVITQRIKTGQFTHNQYVEEGPFAVVFYALVFIFFIAVIYVTLRQKKIAQEVKRIRFKYVSRGTIAVFFLIFLTNVFIPVYIKFFLQDSIVTSETWFIVQQSVGVIGMSILSTFIAYTIIRYRLFEIKVILNKQKLLVLIMTLILLLFCFIVFLVFSYSSPTAVFVVSTVFLVVYWLCFTSIRNWLDGMFIYNSKVVSKNFNKKWYEIDLNAILEEYCVNLCKKIQGKYQLTLSLFVAQRQHNSYLVFDRNGYRETLHFSDSLSKIIRNSNRGFLDSSLRKYRKKTDPNIYVCSEKNGIKNAVAIHEMNIDENIGDIFEEVNNEIISIVNYIASLESVKKSIEDDGY